MEGKLRIAEKKTGEELKESELFKKYEYWTTDDTKVNGGENENSGDGKGLKTRREEKYDRKMEVKLDKIADGVSLKKYGLSEDGFKFLNILLCEAPEQEEVFSLRGSSNIQFRTE